MVRAAFEESSERRWEDTNAHPAPSFKHVIMSRQCNTTPTATHTAAVACSTRTSAVLCYMFARKKYRTIVLAALCTIKNFIRNAIVSGANFSTTIYHKTPPSMNPHLICAAWVLEGSHRRPVLDVNHKKSALHKGIILCPQ